jgi:hypothetical protein
VCWGFNSDEKDSLESDKIKIIISVSSSKKGDEAHLIKESSNASINAS